jgi:hypothetical protein
MKLLSSVSFTCFVWSFSTLVVLVAAVGESGVTSLVAVVIELLVVTSSGITASDDASAAISVAVTVVVVETVAVVIIAGIKLAGTAADGVTFTVVGTGR